MWALSSMVLMVLGVRANGEKLDQVYLPPSGAVTAGGYPGDISAPLPPTFVPILSYHNVPNAGDGSYAFSYETGNGIKASEEGVAKSSGPEDLEQVVQGAYSYTGPDGVLYTLVYTADKNGFQPRGDHLPTAPPVPPEIQVALEQNAAEEAAAARLPGVVPTSPAQVGYFKSHPSVYHNGNYHHYKYVQRY